MCGWYRAGSLLAEGAGERAASGGVVTGDLHERDVHLAADLRGATATARAAAFPGHAGLATTGSLAADAIHADIVVGAHSPAAAAVRRIRAGIDAGREAVAADEAGVGAHAVGQYAAPGIADPRVIACIPQPA